MRYAIVIMTVMWVTGCAAMGGTDQCVAPTPSEAKITKRVWTK